MSQIQFLSQDRPQDSRWFLQFGPDDSLYNLPQLQDTRLFLELPLNWAALPIRKFSAEKTTTEP